MGRDGRVWYQEPDGYPVMNFCTVCGRDFASDRAFTTHRTGNMDHRRCMDDDEMVAKGLARLDDDELRARRKFRSRAGFGIEVWWDPKAAAAAAAQRGSGVQPQP